MEHDAWVHIGTATNAVIENCAERYGMLTKTNASLKTYVDRITRLEEQRSEIAEEIREAFEDAKNEGFTVSALKRAIKIHSLDADKRAKHDAEQTDIEVYLANLEGRTPE